MVTEPLGDSAYLVRDLVLPAYVVADLLNRKRIDGLIEAVAAYDTVGIYVDPSIFELTELEDILETTDTAPEYAPHTRHTIPVCYEMGHDWARVTSHFSIEQEEVINHHLGQSFRCYAIGFCPGFPFLGYLPKAITGLPRLAEPRTSTQPGAVGLTGRQTGVYTLDKPGGWPIIGRTPLTLVDVENNYFPIAAGDEVQFTRIDEAEFHRLSGARL